jgi:8-oxo-dGTP diphosphatase
MVENNVRVGVGVFIFKDGKFLLLKRQGSHGAGTWSVPGGHLEFGESFEDTAHREIEEETNLEIKNLRFAAVTNDHFVDESKHYVTIWLLSDWKTGKEFIKEPNKCTEMVWFTFSDLPDPLFLPWNQLLKSEFIKSIKTELTKSSKHVH